jgi:hypothetical protein
VGGVWAVMFSQNPYIEALTLNMTAFGDSALIEITRLK